MTALSILVSFGGTLIAIAVLGLFLLGMLQPARAMRSHTPTSHDGGGDTPSFGGIFADLMGKKWFKPALLIGSGLTLVGVLTAVGVATWDTFQSSTSGVQVQQTGQQSQQQNVPQSTESLWDTIGTLPIELQLLLAAGAVGLLLLGWWALFGKVWINTRTDSSGKPIAFNEMHVRLRRLALLAITAVGVALAVSLLAQINWEQVDISKLKEVKTDDLWETVQNNLFKVVLMVGLLLLTAAVVAGSIQHLRSGGKGTKHIVSITTFLAWVCVLGFVLVVSVGYMLSDDQKGQIKTAISDTIVSWFQPSNNNEGAEPIIEGRPKTYFKGDLGPMEIGDTKSGWIRFGDTVSATIVGGGCFRIEPEVIRWSEENRPSYSFWVDKPGESPITLRVVDFGPVTDDPKDDCKPASE